MNLKKNQIKKIIWALGAVIFVALFLSVAVAKEVAVIKVQYRWAAALVPVVQTLLSDEGSVTVSQRVNSLVIVDSAEAIQRVYAYLNEFDQPVEQVRIRVRFNSGEAREQEAHAARSRYSSDDLSVAVGGRKRDRDRDRHTTRLRSGEYRRSRQHESFVVAQSGSPAFIRAGKEIPYKTSSPFYKRHSPGGATAEWHSVESGFEVTPIVTGENVILKIVPRIAYDDRQDAVIRFFGAQTELSVPLGQWVEIGGATGEQNEIIREILSQRSQNEQNTTSMSLMVQRQ